MANQICLEPSALDAAAIDGEVVLFGMRSLAPSMSEADARETARRLIDAGNELDRRRRLGH